MKQFKIFAAVFTILFLSSFVTKQLYAADPYSNKDKWEIKSASVNTTCELGGQDVAFKIKIKNTGDVKTTGETVTVKVKVTYKGHDLGEKSINFTPSITNAGKSITLNGLVNNENFKQFTNVAGTKALSFVFNTISWTLTSVSKNVNIKVK